MLGPELDDSESQSSNLQVLTSREIEDTTVEDIDGLPIPIITHKGLYFAKLMKDSINDFSFIQVDLNLECIEGITGVTKKDITHQPFTTEEAIEIMFICGNLNF